MKRSILIYLVLVICLACEKDPAIIENGKQALLVEDEENIKTSFFWAPLIKAEKDDGKVILALIDPRPTTSYAPPGPSNPDYFQIMISEDFQNFSPYKKVDASTSEILIGNLENDKSYSFFVTSHKESYDSIHSDTVMTIPSKELKFERFFTNTDFHVEKVSPSYDMGFISFKSRSKINVENDMLYYKAIASGEIQPVEENSYSASWSRVGNSLVYMTNKLEGITLYPNQLKTLNPEKNTAKTLLEIDFDDYYITNPSFTPDGNSISFLSSRNNVEIYNYDLWKLDPITKEETKLSNFEKLGFYTDGKFDWAISGEEVYLAGRDSKSLYEKDIYKFNLATQTLSVVIDSPWNEKNPVLSPDNTKIAFISERTGEEELWIYDQTNSKYSQLTGTATVNFDSRNTDIQWISNDIILINVFHDEELIVVKAFVK